MLQVSIQHCLNELSDLLLKLSDDNYTRPCHELSGATIGEHSRHIIEMFQCLLTNYETGLVNYDNRQRNRDIQTSTSFALSQISSIQNTIERENKAIVLQQIIDGHEIRIESNYHRELLYNLEHCIHHQALIKVAVLVDGHTELHEHFGVARSTIEYRKQCAQ